MDKIVEEVLRATALIRTFGTEEWGRTIDAGSRDALVWLLEVVNDKHAYIRSQAFRDVVSTAYQMGRQSGRIEEIIRLLGENGGKYVHVENRNV